MLEDYLNEYLREHESFLDRVVEEYTPLLLQKAKLGLATLALATVPAFAAQIGPYLPKDATLVASNPSNTAISVEARFAPMGQNPQLGTPVVVQLAPRASAALDNPLSVDGSVYVTSTGAEPVITAALDANGVSTDLPVLPADAANNRDPQAWISLDGFEKYVKMSGESTSTNTFHLESYGADGCCHVVGSEAYSPSGIVTTGYTREALPDKPGFNNAVEGIPRYSDESKVGVIIVYENPTTLDQRVQLGQTIETLNNPLELYLSTYLDNLKNGRAYFANHEMRGMLLGDERMQGYSHQFAEILVLSPANTTGMTADQLDQWLKDQLDGNTSNGELCHAADPGLYDNDNNGDNGFALAQEPACYLAPFPLYPSEMDSTWSLIRNKALHDYVETHPEMYGGEPGGVPNISTNPTWDSQDPN